MNERKQQWLLTQLLHQYQYHIEENKKFVFPDKFLKIDRMDYPYDY